MPRLEDGPVRTGYLASLGINLVRKRQGLAHLPFLAGKLICHDTSPFGACLTLRLQWRPGDSSVIRGTPCRQTASLANVLASR
jgi:hypothetical protein